MHTHTLPPPPLTHTQQTPSINTTNIDTLLVAADQQQAPPPPEELQDRIHFLFNNLSASNLSEKTDELKGLVGDDHIDWVAQYLVMKRASIEPNFHTLYISFMDTLGSAQLRKTVLRETYRNIKVLDGMMFLCMVKVITMFYLNMQLVMVVTCICICIHVYR